VHAKLRDTDIQRTMTALMKEGYSYPRAVDEAIDADLFKGSNNILGLSYIRAIDALGTEIEPLTIPRLGHRFDDEHLPEARLSRATGLRKALIEGALTEGVRYMLEPRGREIVNGTSLSNGDIVDSLKIIISRMRHAEIRGICMMTEGIEHRIKSRIRR